MKKREIPALLRPKIMDLDYSVLAEVVRQQGRGRDKVLAHITPDEARLLKSRGGRGSINPQTGLPEFEDEFDTGGDDYIGEPSQIAASYPDLYPGGELPAMGQETVFTPGETPYYQPSPDIAALLQAPTTRGIQQAEAPESTYTGPTGAPVDLTYYRGYEEPVINQTTGQPMTAGDLAQYYPGGQYPAVGQKTVYTPEGSAYYGEPTPISPQVPSDKRKQEESAFNFNNLLRALGIGGTALLGARQARQAGQQAPMLRREFQDIGTPYRGMGQERIASGLSGELTAGQQQALQAMRAQGRQQLARAGIRGSTAAMQLEGAVQRQADVFAQQNIDQGIKLLNIADNYTVQGIRAAYQADADARNLAQRFFAATTQMIPQSQPGAVRIVPTAP